MQSVVTVASDLRVVLSAPLAPNINHQSTAFGGSVASLATLACWGWLWNQLRAAGAETVHAQLVVARAEIDYLKPIASAMTAICDAPETAALKSFEEAYARRGRGRITLDAVVEDANGLACARFVGKFVAIRES
jgi:thioesterase domain-containing protein